MKENAMKEKLKKINKEFDEVNKHLKEATETTVLECMYAKDDVDKKIDETKKHIEAAKENIKRKQQETHEKFSSHITKIQDDINDLKSKLEEKKELKDKEKLEKYIDDRLEYSSSCISLAVLAISEAKLSFLEAIEAQEEYDELYKN